MCPICRSENTAKLVDWGDFTIRKCLGCALVYALPLPSDEELTVFYQGFLYNRPTKREFKKHVAHRCRELTELFSLSADSANKTFLDVGAGTGAAYQAAKEIGLHAYYQEIDQEARTFVAENYGLENEYVLDNLHDVGRQFDYVLSDNVIEHLKDPVGFLEQLSQLVAPGGRIVVKTPHAGNKETWFYPLNVFQGYATKALKYGGLANAMRMLFQRTWACDPPRHLYSFSTLSLRRAALNAGFHEEEIQIQFYQQPLFKYSVAERFFSFHKYNSLKQWILRVPALFVLPVELALKVLQLVLRHLGLLSPTGIILVINRKQL